MWKTCCTLRVLESKKYEYFIGINLKILKLLYIFLLMWSLWFELK